VVVIGGRIGHVAAKTCDSLKHIGAREDADELLSTHHGQPLDVLRFHQIDDVGQWHILCDGEGVRGHDLRYLAAMLDDKIVGRCARPEGEAEPATSATLCSDLAPAEEIALGHDTYKLAGSIDNRKAAHVISQHRAGGIDDCRFWCDGDDRLGHDLVGAHG
jgi:hypothetical protein